MSGIKKVILKPKYGGFALAATAYITGILLFTFWSYSTHRNALLNQMDKTLLDATFTMEQILGTNVATALSTESELSSEKKQRLTQLADYGEFNAVEAVLIRDKTVTPLIIGLSSNTAPIAVAMNEYPSLPPDLKKALTGLATDGTDGTTLLTAKHLMGGKVRYAIRFKAKYQDYGIAFLVAQDRKIIDQALADQALRLIAAGLGMFFLAIPLISLFSRTQKNADEELSSMNTRLQNDVDLQLSREEELKEAISDLERFNAVSSGREMRIIELKAEVNELLLQSKCERRYNIDKIDKV